MLETLKRIWRAKQLRNNLLSIIALLVLFRVVAHIPIPGIDIVALQNFFRSNQILGFLSLFTGGTIENFSVVALGVAPYITASIIFQLLGMIFPALEELQKEGEYGKQKINQWSRMLTVPLAALQSFALITLLRQSGQLAGHTSALGSAFGIIVTIATMTAGTIFLMWLGELISEKKVGNGISLLIFAGIIAGLPTLVQRTMTTFDRSQLFVVGAFLLVAVVTVIGVVIINQAERNIPIAYARQMRAPGMVPMVSNHLPLRLNMAGVIPIIFAVSFMMIPSMVARFFIHAKTAWIAGLANGTTNLFSNQIFYGILYFILVVAFTFFYTSIVFQPEKIAENLQKQGAFIPGIRPGNPTSEYLVFVTNRILLAGGVFLALLAVLPTVMRQATNSPLLAIGGTSFLIVVSVIIETVKAVESQLSLSEYDRYSS